MKDIWLKTTDRVVSWKKGAHSHRETRRWNDEVRKVVNEKRCSFTTWKRTMALENRVAHLDVKRTARGAVWLAQDDKRNDFEEELASEEGILVLECGSFGAIKFPE